MSFKQRTFSTAGTFSRRRVIGAVSLAALGAVAIALYGALAQPGERDSAVEDGRRLLSAARAYQAQNGDVGCPTISALEDTHGLGDEARIDDAWGNRFRIVCDGSAIRVEAAGPDHRAGTRDDVRVE